MKSRSAPASARQRPSRGVRPRLILTSQGGRPELTMAAGIASRSVSKDWRLPGGQLEARLDRIQNRNYRAAANQRLANHLRTERNAMFTFSLLPGIGGDKISRRASHSSHGGNPQGLGRQSHRAGRTHAKRIGQHFANLPSAASARPAFLEQLLHMPKAQHLELTPPHTR